MRKRMTVVALALVAAGGLAGCGEDNKVGDESLLNFEEQAGQRLGEITTTTAATPAAEAPGAPAGEDGGAGTAAPAAPDDPAPEAPAATQPAATQPPATAPATTATTAARAPVATLEIVINGDGSSDPPLDPQTAQVYAGSIVRWVNRDVVPRSVQAANGAFRSPAIPPGGSFDWTAARVGVFDYGDGTRPYVNATLEVLEQP